MRDREIDTNTKKEPGSAKSRHRRNKIFWGVESPNLARKLLVSLLWLTIIVMFYGIMSRGFYPSESWKIFSIPASMIFSLGATRALSQAYKTGKIKPKNGKTPSRSVWAFFLVFLFPLMFWMTITHGLAKVYTEWLGATAMKTVIVSKKQKTRAYKSYTTSYCLKSEELNGDIFSKLCVKKDDYDRIKVGSSMAVYGKESWFGFAFEKYKLIQE